MMPLDVLACTKTELAVTGDVIDIGAGCQTLVFTAIASDTLKVKSGDVNPPTKYATGADAADADGSDSCLQLQIIRPSQQYWKIEADATKVVVVQHFSVRNESVPITADVANAVSVNSPDSPDLRA